MPFKPLSLIPFILICSIISLPGQKEITLEDVWKNGKLSPYGIPGFHFQNDGKHCTLKSKNQIIQLDIRTGKPTQLVVDGNVLKSGGLKGNIEDYSFSSDEKKILIETEREKIYRRSSRSNYYVYDRAAKQLTPVFKKGKHRLATFNPNANKVAFVYKNNLYYKDLTSDKVIQITTDGAFNKIINGATDWVYEEEFSFDHGFEWSPDGNKIAFFRFDESAVKQFTMTNYRNEAYPEYETFKYPKVGEENAKVSIHIYDLKSGTTIRTQTDVAYDHYIPRIKWTNSAEQLCIYRLNRHQNHIELLLANAKGETKLLLEEKNKYYIDEMVFDNLTFLEDGKNFIWTSEMDGWHHIYLYNLEGEKIRQITKGQWDVTDFYGLDKKRREVLFQAAKNSAMDRQIFRVGLDGNSLQAISKKAGWNEVKFTTTFDYYILTHSTINEPNSYTVFDYNGKEILALETNEALKEKQKEYAMKPIEFFDFETSAKVKLNGWMIKPSGFQENREYPVLMFVYGGPGSQQVKDKWIGERYGWFQMLAQQGYVIACVDNRGTGGRGEEFKKMTYLQLGKYETIDQIEAAKYLGRLPFIDKNRIGIFGWSYGGYMSSLCLLKGSDVFKVAIAVAPVTNWKWYDSVYTERFMRTREENPEGYEQNSPINFVDQLKGNYLLAHGLGDDNVHFQQTAEMANALIEANKQFDTYFYPNRAHSLRGGNARLHLYTKMTNFLNEKLKAVPSEKP